MICPKCSKTIPDTSKFCPECGADVSPESSVRKTANEAFNRAEKELGSAVQEVAQSFKGGDSAPRPSYTAAEHLKDDRGLLSYILLSVITCGIYSYYFIYKLAHDVNIACEGDGSETGGLVQYIVLSILTCGIYALYWEYKLANRLAANAPRYQMSFQENGTTVLLWYLVGMFICGIGPFVAMHILIKNANRICNAYNRYNHI